MSFALVPKQIHCGRCDYEGAERFLGAGVCGTYACLGVVIVAFVYPAALPLALVVAIWMWWTPCYPKCPSCGWEHAVPVALHRENLKLADRCPCRINGSCDTVHGTHPRKAEGQGASYPVAIRSVAPMAARALPPEEDAQRRSP